MSKDATLGQGLTPLMPPELSKPAVFIPNGPDGLRLRAMALTAPLTDLGQTADTAELRTILPISKHAPEDLAGILARRQLRVLTVASRDSGVLNAPSRRIEQDISYQVARHLERISRLPTYSGGHSLRVQVIAVPEAMLVPSLLGGLGDVALARPDIIRPSELLGVSPHINVGPNQIVVGNEFSSPVAALRDLAGRRVLVRAGSRQQALLTELNARLVRDGLPQATLTEADALSTDEDMLDMVAAGYADLVVAPEPLARTWKRRNAGLRTFPQAVLEQGGPMVLLTRSASPKLHDGLDRFAAERRKQSQRLAQSRSTRHVEAFSNKDPLSPKDYARFHRYAPLFQKYAARYDLDWMLLAALCYQESAFGIDGTSHRGAMGLMQIMPATAQTAGLGNPFTSDDANVHAGAKYLSYLRNRYESTGMGREEATRFAIAAYNAGPGKIERVRQLTARMGLDPNRWNGNCEVASQRIIGRETNVTVSSVMKYRLVYQLALGREGQRAKPAVLAELRTSSRAR